MKRSLFYKYVTLFVALVSVVLVINSALDLYFVYQDNRRASIDVLMDRELPAEERQHILKIVQAHPGVRNVHELRTRTSGLTKFIQLQDRKSVV